MLLPAEAQPLLAAFVPHFTAPTYIRFVALNAAAILTTGRRTVANLRRTVGDLSRATTPATDGSCRRPSGRTSNWGVPWPGSYSPTSPPMARSPGCPFPRSDRILGRILPNCRPRWRWF